MFSTFFFLGNVAIEKGNRTKFILAAIPVAVTQISITGDTQLLQKLCGLF